MDIFKYLLCDRGYQGLKMGPTILNQSLYLRQLQLVPIPPQVSPSMWGIKADFSSLEMADNDGYLRGHGVYYLEKEGTSRLLTY